MIKNYTRLKLFPNAPIGQDKRMALDIWSFCSSSCQSSITDLFLLDQLVDKARSPGVFRIPADFPKFSSPF